MDATSKAIIFVLVIGLTFEFSNIAILLWIYTPTSIFSREMCVNLLITYWLPATPVIIHKLTVQMVADIFNLEPTTGIIITFIIQIGLLILIGGYKGNPQI